MGSGTTPSSPPPHSHTQNQICRAGTPKCGRAERRRRLLPARVVVYYILAMCL
ncbi:MAG TPA: transposase domain-containing protein, partial [Actinomycetes bacterium]